MSEKTLKDKKIKQAAEPKQYVYCGPTLKNGVLQQYSVFQGELPSHVKKLAAAEVAIKELIVDVKELGYVRKNLAIKGSLENQLFEKALIYAKGGNK